MPDPEESDIALCLNVGSSSLKFALFRVDPGAEACLASGAIEELGTAAARAHLKAGERELERPCASLDLSAALGIVFGLLEEAALPRAVVVGHRVVHGGREHLTPARIDAALIESLRQLVPLAPLHMPAALAGIEASRQHAPEVLQVACFDTAFHAHLPEHAARLALPSRWFDEGVRRYGFHGLSYEYVLSTLGEPPPQRLIIAHLGNGASLAAIQNGRSVDTTMGFTPAGGIMMGTRAGDLDPGLLLYLLRERGYTPDTLEHLVDRESGLLGVGGSADLRVLSERLAIDERARLALTMMGYAVRKAIGAYVAVLGGVDALVFTGGIGEHSPFIRAEACRGLDCMGIALDNTKNAQNAPAIHSLLSDCRVLVVETDEDRMIARQAATALRNSR
ncbi:MAG TPA: acetate/propionate family kinase [Polyangiaceae bacterium]